MAGNFVDSLVIGIGLDASQVARGVQEVGRTIDSGLKGAFDNAVKGVSPLGEALKSLKQDADNLTSAVDNAVKGSTHLGDALKNFGKDAEDRAVKALNELGVRSADQIQQKIAELQTALDKINASSTLTARDKQAAIDEITRRIGTLKNELAKGIPQAAAEGFAGAEAAAGRFKGFISSIWAQVSGPLLGAFATGNAISSYISNSMSAGELADKLKVDIEEIQIWSGAMDRAGGSAAALQGTIEKLNASGKAQGDAIGVLLDLADKAGTMSKEAFVQKAKELEIDEKTIEVLAQGRKALDEHLKRQRELGAYTKEDAEQSKKFKQSLADLLQAWDGFTSFIGRFTVPIMRVLADALTAVVVFMRQHTPFVVAAITMIGAALAVRLLPPLRTLPDLIANVGKAFLRWLPFVAIITAIALLVEDFWVYLQGGESELAEFWAIFGTGPEIMAKLNAAWKETKGYLAAIGTGLAQMVRYWYDLMQASGMFAALGQTFKGLLQILKGIFTLDWSLLGEGLSNVLNGMVKGVASAFKGLGILVKDAVQAIFKALWDNLPGFSSWALGVAETLKGIFRLDPSMIWNGIKNVFDGVGSMIAAGLKGWLTLCANSWSAIIEVFTGQKIDLAAWVDEAWQKAANVFNDAKNFVTQWISSLFGDGEVPDFGAIAQKIWTSITETFGKIKEWVVNWFKGLFTGVELPKIGDILGGAGDLAKGAAGAAGSLLGKGLDLAKGAAGKAGDLLGNLLGSASEGAAKVGEKLGPMLQGGLEIAQKGMGALQDFFGTVFGDAQPATEEAGGKIESGMTKTAGLVRDGFNAAWQATAGFGVQAFQGAAATIQQIFAGIVSGIETQVGNLVLGAQRMAGEAGGMVPAAAGVRAQNAGTRNFSQTNNNRITIHAPGGDPRAVQQGVQRGLSQSNKTMPAQSGTVVK